MMACHEIWKEQVSLKSKQTPTQWFDNLRVDVPILLKDSPCQAGSIGPKLNDGLLLLIPGLFDDARKVIISFAASLRHGLIPNLLDGGRNPR